MEYEWDEAKRSENLAKHGVAFSMVEGLAWDTAAIRASHLQGETRLVAIGYIEERLHVVVYTIKDRTRRIISLGKANERERRRYGQQNR